MRLIVTFLWLYPCLSCGGLEGVALSDATNLGGLDAGSSPRPSANGGVLPAPMLGTGLSSQRLEIEATPAETGYLNHWIGQDHGEPFVSSLNGCLTTFMSRESSGSIYVWISVPVGFDWEYLESIRQIIEERVWEWQIGLIGELIGFTTK